MSKDRDPREYFEYYQNFIAKIEEIGKVTNDEQTESIEQSLFEIVKGTLKDSAGSLGEKKNILKGFAEIIKNKTEEQNKLPESDKIVEQTIVFNEFAEILEQPIQDETISENWQKCKEELEEIVTAIKPQELTQDIFCLPGEEKAPLELNNSSVDVPSFSADNLDPITKAIREHILTKQRAIIAAALVNKSIAKPEELDDLNKFRAYFENEQNKETISGLLKEDQNLKHALEQVEIAGYKNVHTQFAGRFSTMEWKDGGVENANGITIKKQIVRDANGHEIATLSEANHQINPPHTVQKSDGTSVAISNYRTIDFPIKLDNNGPMHLSLAVKDQYGKNIAASNAVYFTAHYDDAGKLIEVSSPHPVKFTGNSPDAVGYIEHGGKIYTLPVTQEKYRAMMQEVAKNLGQGVNISPSIESIEAPDLAVTSRGAKSEVDYIKPGEQMPAMQESKIMMQEESKNLEHSVDISPFIDVPLSMNSAIPGQNIEETPQLHKVPETTMLSNDMVKMEPAPDILEYPHEKVNVITETKTTKISQAVLINTDVRNRAEDIKASLSRSQHIGSSTRKTDVDIAQLVGELSNLENKVFDTQKKHIEAKLDTLTSKEEQAKLLQRLLKATAKQRGKELSNIEAGQRKPDADAVRLLTENRAGKEGEIVKPQQRAEHANVRDNVKMQAFLQNKINEINEVSKKPAITVKPRNAGGHGF